METYGEGMANAATHPGGAWGAYIDSVPKRKGMTLTQLAERSGIARNTFYKWKRGETGVTVDSVKRVAKAADDPEEMALRAASGLLVDEHQDPQLREIYASDLTDEVKQELVDFVLEERVRGEDALRSNLRRMISAYERGSD